MSNATLRTRGTGPEASFGPAGQMASPAPLPPASVPNLPSLRQLPFFAGVPDEALAALGARSRWQVYAPGEVVVDSGDATDEVFLVVEGAVRVVVRTALGYEAI